MKRLRDRDIRQPLDQWLTGEYCCHPEKTTIIHELKIPRPSARADIAVVNGELTGLEIKSDVDDLTRLPRQARSFNQFFDRVVVVTAQRHLAKLQLMVPDWWGIYTADSTRGTLAFEIHRAGERNPTPNTAALLHALSRSELFAILGLHHLKVSRGIKKDCLVAAVLDQLPVVEIRSAARELMKIRPTRYV